MLFNLEQQDRVMKALPSSSGDYQMPGHNTQPPPLPTFPADKFEVMADHRLLAHNGDLTIKVAEDAIAKYNEAHPFHQIDILSIDRTGMHHNTYLHNLMLKMRGRIRIRDDSDNSLVFNK